MKRCLSVALLTVLTATAICVRAQGTFQNLDFEAAELVYVNSGPVDIVASNALPGWSAFAGANQLSTIVFGATGLIYPVNLRAQTNGGSLSGNFSLFLGKGGSGAPEAGSISQTGLVPVGTQSLIFKVGTLFNGPFTVSLGGQNLSYAPLASAPGYTSYGADISSFAGQTDTLVFMAGINGGSGAAMIDDIQFSPIAIPEPSAVALLGLGALCFAARRFRGRRGTP